MRRCFQAPSVRTEIRCWSAVLARAAHVSRSFPAALRLLPVSVLCCVALWMIMITILARDMIRMADCVNMEGGKDQQDRWRYEYNSHWEVLILKKNQSLRSWEYIFLCAKRKKKHIVRQNGSLFCGRVYKPVPTDSETATNERGSTSQKVWIQWEALQCSSVFIPRGNKWYTNYTIYSYLLVTNTLPTVNPTRKHRTTQIHTSG